MATHGRLDAHQFLALPRWCGLHVVASWGLVVYASNRILLSASYRMHLLPDSMYSTSGSLVRIGYWSLEAVNHILTYLLVGIASCSHVIIIYVDL